MSKSYYIYINSKNRNNNEEIYDFNVYLNNPISCNRNQAINVNVIGFSMLNTDYNCKGLYFKINVYERESPFDFIETINFNIPDGNYSYLSLMELLNSLLVGKIRVEYIKHKNTYKFINITTDKTINIQPFNANNILGIQTNLLTIETTGSYGTYINLSNYSHIIIKSNNLDFQDSVQDNITYNSLGISTILFMIDKQDIQPFQLISYKNYDNGNNYTYNITNKMINIIDLQLYNERNELLTNTSDYLLILKFVVNDIEVNSNPLSLLEDIRFLIMSSMFNKNKNLIL